MRVFAPLMQPWTQIATGDGGQLVRWNFHSDLYLMADVLSGQQYINDLINFNGYLYGCTGDNGRLFQAAGVFGLDKSLVSWSGGTEWDVECDQLNAQTAIFSFKIFDDELYASTGNGGALFQLSGATATQNSLLVWDGSSAWDVAATRLNNQEFILSLIEHNSLLYASTGSGGRLFEWDDTDMAWVEVAPQLGSSTNVTSMAILGSDLYGAANGGADLLIWDGSSAWSVAASGGAYDVARSLVAYSGLLWGILCTGVSARGALFHSDGTSWANTVPSTPSALVGFLVSTAGRLFVIESQSNDIALKEYVGTTTYTERSDDTSSGSWGSALCVTVFSGIIWIGTDGGYLLSIGLNGSAATAFTVEDSLTGAQVTSLTVFDSKLYAGTSNGGLWEWDGAALVQVAGDLSAQNPITAMIDYDSKLMAGVSI